MRQFSSLLTLIAFGLSVNAQQTDTAVAAVRYKFSYVTDTTQPADVSSENMVLFIGSQSSVFKSHDKYLRDSVMREQFEKQTAVPGGPVSIVSPQGMKMGTPTAFYKFPLTNTLAQLEILMKYYQIDEEIPVINWAISQDTKSIQGLSCQKATAIFRGRNYTAWFTSQLPYSNGPWKLGGLPGLIMEAEDDKKEVVFAFDSFQDVTGRKIVITTPGNAIHTNRKDFSRLREAATNNPQSMRPNTGGSGSDISIQSARASGSSSGTNVKRKVNNNPIEKG